MSNFVWRKGYSMSLHGAAAVTKKPALGAMMAGGNPASGEREEDDFYPTPPEATRGLLAVESFTGAIWECACGDGAISRELLASGYRVVSTDLVSRGFGAQLDFFAVKPRKVANILTNPPFNLAAQFIEHAMLFDPDKLALLLKATYWHAIKRQPLFQKFKPARIYPLTWRLDFLNLDRPTMETQWCVWERGHVGEPRYIPLLKAEVDREKPRANRKKLAISR